MTESVVHWQRVPIDADDDIATRIDGIEHARRIRIASVHDPQLVRRDVEVAHLLAHHVVRDAHEPRTQVI